MSRDPSRVKPLCDEIARVWSLPQFVDERFGQFVLNLTRDHEGRFEDPWEWDNRTWYERLAYRESETR